jgi:small GTP-binding protein
MFLSRECGEDALLVIIASSLADESALVKQINRCASVLRHALEERKSKEIKKEYRDLIDSIIICRYVIALVGASAVGKTSLLHLFMGCEAPTTYEPTIALNTEILESIRFANCELAVIDFSGQEKTRSMWDLSNVDLVFLLTDSTLSNIIESKTILSDIGEKYQSLPVVLIANKQDLPNALDSSAIGKVMGVDAYHMVAIDLAYREQLLDLLVQILCRQFEIPVPDTPLSEILSSVS